MSILDKTSEDVILAGQFMGYEWLQMKLGWVDEEKMEVLDYRDLLPFNQSWEWLVPLFKKVYKQVNPYVPDREYLREALLSFRKREIWEACIQSIRIINNHESQGQNNEGEGETYFE